MRNRTLLVCVGFALACAPGHRSTVPCVATISGSVALESVPCLVDAADSASESGTAFGTWGLAIGSQRSDQIDFGAGVDWGHGIETGTFLSDDPAANGGGDVTRPGASTMDEIWDSDASASHGTWTLTITSRRQTSGGAEPAYEVHGIFDSDLESNLGSGAAGVVHLHAEF